MWKLGTTFTATITPSGTGFCANETAISDVETAINGAGTTLYATRRHHRPQPVLVGVATQAYPESALEVLLSRMPLDLDTGASHHTKNHPIETLQLSRPPCPMRVYPIDTHGMRRMECLNRIISRILIRASLQV